MYVVAFMRKMIARKSYLDLLLLLISLEGNAINK